MGFYKLLFISQLFIIGIHNAIIESSGCYHNGTIYADKSFVPTLEPCLSCRCNTKTLICSLKVCPEMPVPPPRGCVLVQRKHSCCPYISCYKFQTIYPGHNHRIVTYLDHFERESIDRIVNDNHLQKRSDDSDVDGSEDICVKNGTVYKSGSAMSSSSLCSYCYCIAGQQKCVKPKCMLPLDGCKPIYVDSTCCPVRYDCSFKGLGKSSEQSHRARKTGNKHYQRMTQRLQRNRGCSYNGNYYHEGSQMPSDPAQQCDICFCIRGIKRCAPKKCTPALKNCIPVIPKGQCCPSSYDCGRELNRSYQSRQIGLFSLIFGSEENENTTEKQSNQSISNESIETTSSKSIFDFIREGLEYIDGTSSTVNESSEVSEHLPQHTSPIPAQNDNLGFFDILLSPSKNSSTEIKEAEEQQDDDYKDYDFLGLLLGEQQNTSNNFKEQETNVSTNNFWDEFTTSFSTGNYSIDYFGLSDNDTDDDAQNETQMYQSHMTTEETSEDNTSEDNASIEDISTEEMPENDSSTAESLDNIENESNGTEVIQARTTDSEEQFSEEEEDESSLKHTTKIIEVTSAEGINSASEIDSALLEYDNDNITENSNESSDFTTEDIRITTELGVINETQKTLSKKSTNLASSVNGLQSTSSTPNPKEKQNKHMADENLTKTNFFTTELTTTHSENEDNTQLEVQTPTMVIETKINNFSNKLNLTELSNKTTKFNEKVDKNLQLDKITSNNSIINNNLHYTTSMPLITETIEEEESDIFSLLFDGIASLIPEDDLNKTNTPALKIRPESDLTQTPANETVSDFKLEKRVSNNETFSEDKINITIISDSSNSNLLTDSLQTSTENLESERIKNQTTTLGLKKNKPTQNPSVFVSSTLPVTSIEPVSIKTNPSILDVDLEYGHGTLPPSLPNLKIIPFLPVDAVPIIDKRPNRPTFLEEKHDETQWESFESDVKLSKPYDHSLPSITYPNTEKSDYINRDVEKVTYPSNRNRFSPPTKTEGGFVPKEPIVEGNLYYGTKLIIELTTASPPNVPKATKSVTNTSIQKEIIEITSTDPFKDVIKTEKPPDLTTLIEDKEKLSVKNQYQSAPLEVIHITTDANYNYTPEFKQASDFEYKNSTLLNADESESLIELSDQNHKKTTDIMPSDYQEYQLNNFFDYLFGINSSVATTVPAFKSLPQKLITVTTKSSKRNETIIIKDSSNVEEKINDENFSILEKLFFQNDHTLPASELYKPIPHRKMTTVKEYEKKISSNNIKDPFKGLPGLIPSYPVKIASSSPYQALKHAEEMGDYQNDLDLIISQINKKTHLKGATYTVGAYKILPNDSTPLSSDVQAINPIDIDALRKQQNDAEIFVKPENTNGINDPVLKLAGCNIYGRMYRVGRIISELSDACLECKCTEIGVSCTSLECSNDSIAD